MSPTISLQFVARSFRLCPYQFRVRGTFTEVQVNTRKGLERDTACWLLSCRDIAICPPLSDEGETLNIVIMENKTTSSFTYSTPIVLISVVMTSFVMRRLDSFEVCASCGTVRYTYSRRKIHRQQTGENWPPILKQPGQIGDMGHTKQQQKRLVSNQRFRLPTRVQYGHTAKIKIGNVT